MKNSHDISIYAHIIYIRRQKIKYVLERYKEKTNKGEFSESITCNRTSDSHNGFTKARIRQKHDLIQYFAKKQDTVRDRANKSSFFSLNENEITLAQ